MTQKSVIYYVSENIIQFHTFPMDRKHDFNNIYFLIAKMLKLMLFKAIISFIKTLVNSIHRYQRVS